MDPLKLNSQSMPISLATRVESINTLQVMLKVDMQSSSSVGVTMAQLTTGFAPTLGVVHGESKATSESRLETVELIHLPSHAPLSLPQLKRPPSSEQ